MLWGVRKKYNTEPRSHQSSNRTVKRSKHMVVPMAMQIKVHQ